MSLALDELLDRLGSLDDQERREIVQRARSETHAMVWIPNPGPQTEAYFSEADEVGYGGEAGGGKTDLGIGLALTAHQRTLQLRRTNREALKLVERYSTILGSREGWNGQDKVWRLPGRVVDIGGCQIEDDKQKYKGDPHDLIHFDEVVDFTETQYTFIIGWNRSADPNQRCRVLATFNPPTRPVGMWVLRRWGPWLDPKHPRPAKDGELRWYTTIEDEDTEVDGPGPHLINGEWIRAKSRTFIRAKLEDNPDLSKTGDYAATLAALPAEYRDAYRGGRFDAGLRDQPFQCIPTEWVRAAFARWTDKPPAEVPMCAMGVDASGGGVDPMVIARRHDGWYHPNISIPGKELPADRMGRYAGGIIITYRLDKCPIIVDMGGGYGGSIVEHLKENDVEVYGFKGAEESTRRTKDKLLKFYNRRSEVYWRFREALDPGQPGGSPIALPENPNTLADLTSPTFELTPRGIKLENKDDVCDRLGRSPDDGDAVVMCWSQGLKMENAGAAWMAKRSGRGQYPKVISGRKNRR